MGEITARTEDHIRAAVRQLPGGGRLPSERSLVDELGVSRSTVRLVLLKLIAEGEIAPQHGRGYYKR